MKKLLQILCLCLICAYGAFDEDSYLFEAIELEEQKNFDKARDMYLVLYEESGKLEYFKEALILSSLLNNPSATLDFANEYIAKGGELDLQIHKVFLDCYLKLGLSDRALDEAQIIAKSEESPLIDDILGSLYGAKGELDKALSHLNRAYERTYSQDILQKIIAIYLAKKQDTKAFNQLDTHLKNYGCAGYFCKLSIELYARTNKIAQLEEMFLNAFNANPTIENAQNLILIYAYRQKFKEAANIAGQFPFKPEVLLELYLAQKDFDNAAQMALKIYQQNKNPYHLAIAQTYRFEAQSPKLTKPLSRQSKAVIEDIAKELKNALSLMAKAHEEAPKDERVDAMLQNAQSTEVGVFLNFLGYLMIDYELDVKEGVRLVKKALEIAPQNGAYLDSLAWGYYKLKDCENAAKTFALIPESDIQKEQEMQEHKSHIQKCKF